MRIQQATLFLKGGPCILNLTYWDAKLDADMFGSLLIALDCFSMEALGLELCEFSTQKQRVFLSRIDGMIIALVAEDSTSNYFELKSRIPPLIERIRNSIESLGGLTAHSWIQDGSEAIDWLRTKIHQEIARTFPDSWKTIPIDTQILLDLMKIRILTFLSDQERHTRYEMGKQLRLPRSKVETSLHALSQEGFTIVETISVGRRKIRKFTISELGKLALDTLDTFPGLWFQKSS